MSERDYLGPAFEPRLLAFTDRMENKTGKAGRTKFDGFGSHIASTLLRGQLLDL